jgi:AraC-like DNA-binding protein
MNDIRKDSYYLNNIAVLTQENENYHVYTISPQYGEGTFTIFKVVPGLDIAFNNFISSNKISNSDEEYELFSQPFFKINYCLKGKMLAYNRKGKVCVSNKGSTSYYAGIENVYTVEHFDTQYKSITLYGYINEVADFFEQIFQVEKNLFFDFCKSINNEEKEFIVIKSDTTAIRLVNEISTGFKNNENENVRLKAIELLLYELKNFEKNKKRKEIYYSRSTIDKVVDVEGYIIKNLDKKLTIGKLSSAFDISIDTLKRCFKQMYLSSIYAYIKKTRMEKGKELLKNSDKAITEIALICGYSNHHSFSKAFKEHYKITPREIRKAY